MNTTPRIHAAIRLYTLTVDTPGNGIDTSVHPSEEAALDHLHRRFDPNGELGRPGDDLQRFCDGGFVIKIAEHDLDIRLVDVVEAAKSALEAWRDTNPNVCDYRVTDGIANLSRAFTAVDHHDRGEQTPEWNAAMANFKAFLDTAS